MPVTFKRAATSLLLAMLSYSKANQRSLLDAKTYSKPLDGVFAGYLPVCGDHATQVGLGRVGVGLEPARTRRSGGEGRSWANSHAHRPAAMHAIAAMREGRPDMHANALCGMRLHGWSTRQLWRAAAMHCTLLALGQLSPCQLDPRHAA